MKADVRPRNEIGRHYVSFGVTFVILHQIVNTVLDRSSASSSSVHVTLNNANDHGSRVARKRSSGRRDVMYYLLNFGVTQSPDGNDEERIAIREVLLKMEDYMRKWIVKYDQDEASKEIW